MYIYCITAMPTMVEKMLHVLSMKVPQFKQDILRNKTMYQSLPSASVYTFLCTRNLGPEELSVTAV